MLTNAETIKSILNRNNLWPKKNLGQNFLIDEEILNKITANAEIKSNDFILEIGPGVGFLTEKLSEKARLVLAVEKDFKMVEFLRKKFKNVKNVKIIHTDILSYDLALMTKDYKIVANLPYNISSPVIKKFLETDNKPSLLVLMLQKEVAERLSAKPGDSNRGILTVMIELFGEAEIVENVMREKFYPMPDVDSAVIKIKVKSEKINFNPVSFMRFVKVGFSQKRRQIHHPLIAGLKLSKPEVLDILKLAKINFTKRAEDLALSDWVSLYQIIAGRN